MPRPLCPDRAHDQPSRDHHRFPSDLMLPPAPVELGTIRLVGPSHPAHDPHQLTLVGDTAETAPGLRITQLVQVNGRWLDHPLHQQLLDAAAHPSPDGVSGLLREIPIRLPHDSPDLVMDTRLHAFDIDHQRLVCVEMRSQLAHRLTDAGPQEVSCAGPQGCSFATGAVHCKRLAQVRVQVVAHHAGNAPGGAPKIAIPPDDTDNAFVIRSASTNTLRNLEARLMRYWAKFGRRLTGIPFKLVCRARTTAGSGWRPFAFLDLLLDGVSEAEALQHALAHAQQREASGLDIAAWEAVIRAGKSADGTGLDASGNADDASLMEEFYTAEPRQPVNTPPPKTSSIITIKGLHRSALPR